MFYQKIFLCIGYHILKIYHTSVRSKLLGGRGGESRGGSSERCLKWGGEGGALPPLPQKILIVHQAAIVTNFNLEDGLVFSW